MRRLFILFVAAASLAAQVPIIQNTVQFKDTRTGINTALQWLDTNKGTRTSGAVDPSASCTIGDSYVNTATRHLFWCVGGVPAWLDLGFASAPSYATLTGVPSDNIALTNALNLKADLTALTTHTSRTDNPHSVTKTQVGLGSVINAIQLQASLNLSDLGSISAARTNLGLGGAALLAVGTTAGTVAAGDHNHTGVYSAVGHAHAASDITSGVFSMARLASSGTCNSSTVLYGDSACRAQTTPSFAALTGVPSDNSALATALNAKGTILKGTGSPVASVNCGTIGDLYYQTDGPVGQRLFSCTATGTPGTWAQEISGSVLRGCTVIFTAANGLTLQTTDGRTDECSNLSGSDVTITSIACKGNATGLNLRPILQGGSPTSLVTGDIACGNGTFVAGTLSTTPTLHSFATAASCPSTGCAVDTSIAVAAGSWAILQITY